MEYIYIYIKFFLAIFLKSFSPLTGKTIAQTAVSSVLDGLLGSADERLVSPVALLVLNAAFDTLDHPILLKRLETTFGVRGTVLDWCVSYLSGRFRSVIVDSVVSASRPLVYPSPGFRVGTGFVYLVLSAFVRCDFCP